MSVASRHDGFEFHRYYVSIRNGRDEQVLFDVCRFSRKGKDREKNVILVLVIKKKTNTTYTIHRCVVGAARTDM